MQQVTPPNPPPSPASSRQMSFNAEFQALIDRISGDKIQEEYSIFSHLSRLSRDFKSAALQYGKTIISEKYLSDDTKTVKVSGKMGGEAGGEKYIVHGNILFSFSTDRIQKENLYENDGFARKESGHQLKSFVHFRQAGGEYFRFPLMMLIDYKGFRLSAMSLLPISHKSLVYGSDDGGETLKHDAKVKRLMEQVGQTLHLKAHLVGNNTHPVIGPGDIEIHRSEEDSRLYCIDFARLFPPEPIAVGLAVDRLNPHLTRLLRPELLRDWKSRGPPLSSDAFSNFEADKSMKHNMEVSQAWLHLMTHVIPRFARYLDSIASQSTCVHHKKGKPDKTRAVYSCDPRTVYHTGYARLSCGCVCDFGLSQGRARFGEASAETSAHSRKRRSNGHSSSGGRAWLPGHVDVTNTKAWMELQDTTRSYGFDVELTSDRRRSTGLEESSDSDSDEEISANASEFRDSAESRFVCGSFDNRKLKLLMHSHGINMRYLGLVHSLVKCELWKLRLEVEMVARSIRTRLDEVMRNHMKKVNLATAEPYRRIAMHTINLLFGCSDESNKFWNETLVKHLQHRYGFGRGYEHWRDTMAMARAQVAQHQILREADPSVLGDAEKYLTRLYGLLEGEGEAGPWLARDLFRVQVNEALRHGVPAPSPPDSALHAYRTWRAVHTPSMLPVVSSEVHGDVSSSAEVPQEVPHDTMKETEKGPSNKGTATSLSIRAPKLRQHGTEAGYGQAIAPPAASSQDLSSPKVISSSSPSYDAAWPGLQAPQAAPGGPGPGATPPTSSYASIVKSASFKSTAPGALPATIAKPEPTTQQPPQPQQQPHTVPHIARASVPAPLTTRATASVASAYDAVTPYLVPSASAGKPAASAAERLQKTAADKYGLHDVSPFPYALQGASVLRPQYGTYPLNPLTQALPAEGQVPVVAAQQQQRWQPPATAQHYQPWETAAQPLPRRYGQVPAGLRATSGVTQGTLPPRTSLHQPHTRTASQPGGRVKAPDAAATTLVPPPASEAVPDKSRHITTRLAASAVLFSDFVTDITWQSMDKYQVHAESLHAQAMQQLIAAGINRSQSTWEGENWWNLPGAAVRFRRKPNRRTSVGPYPMKIQDLIASKRTPVLGRSVSTTASTPASASSSASFSSAAGAGGAGKKALSGWGRPSSVRGDRGQRMPTIVASLSETTTAEATRDTPPRDSGSSRRLSNASSAYSGEWDSGSMEEHKGSEGDSGEYEGEDSGPAPSPRGRTGVKEASAPEARFMLRDRVPWFALWCQLSEMAGLRLSRAGIRIIVALAEAALEHNPAIHADELSAWRSQSFLLPKPQDLSREDSHSPGIAFSRLQSPRLVRHSSRLSAASKQSSLASLEEFPPRSPDKERDRGMRHIMSESSGSALWKRLSHAPSPLASSASSPTPAACRPSSEPSRGALARQASDGSDDKFPYPVPLQDAPSDASGQSYPPQPVLYSTESTASYSTYSSYGAFSEYSAVDAMSTTSRASGNSAEDPDDLPDTPRFFSEDSSGTDAMHDEYDEDGGNSARSQAPALTEEDMLLRKQEAVSTWRKKLQRMAVWRFPVEDVDVRDPVERVKQSPFLNYAMGTELLLRARTYKPQASRRFAEMSKEMFEKALTLSSSDPETLTNFSFLMSALFSKLLAAERLLWSAVQANSQFVRAHYYLALLYFHNYKDYDKADRAFQRALQVAPDHVNSLRDYAKFLMKTNQQYGTYDDVEALLQRALAIDPQNPRVLQTYGYFLRDRRRSSKSIDYLRLALEADPDDLGVLVDFAHTQVRFGDRDLASQGHWADRVAVLASAVVRLREGRMEDVSAIRTGSMLTSEKTMRFMLGRAALFLASTARHCVRTLAKAAKNGDAAAREPGPEYPHASWLFTAQCIAPGHPGVAVESYRYYETLDQREAMRTVIAKAAATVLHTRFHWRFKDVCQLIDLMLVLKWYRKAAAVFHKIPSEFVYMRDVKRVRSKLERHGLLPQTSRKDHKKEGKGSGKWERKGRRG